MIREGDVDKYFNQMTDEVFLSFAKEHLSLQKKVFPREKTVSRRLFNELLKRFEVRVLPKG